MKKNNLFVVLTLFSFTLISCEVDILGLIDAGISAYQSFKPSRGLQQTLIENFEAPSSRGELTQDASEILQSTTKASYITFDDLGTDSDNFEKDLKKKLSESKSVVSIYCDDMKKCVVGTIKNGNVTNMVVVNEENGAYQTFGLTGRFKKDKVLSLSASGEIFKLFPFVKGGKSKK